MDSNSTNQSKQPLPDERQLVHQAKAGNSEAFGVLYDAYVERIFRFVFFRVADEQTAEDITAQVFLRAWEKLGNYRIGTTPFLAWLYTIARNAVIDHYRTRKESVALDDVAFSQPDHAESSDYRIDLAAEVQSLSVAMQTLTDDQRRILLLKFIEGMSTDQIAQYLGKSEGAIRALQMRALQALAKRLEEQKEYERA